MLRRWNLLVLVIMAMMTLGPVALRAVEPESTRPGITAAELEVQAGRIAWYPKQSYERLVLTVAGPGDWYLERSFGPGEALSLDLVDGSGGRLADGIYAWELRPTPGPLMQSGYFTVREGSLVQAPSTAADRPGERAPGSRGPLGAAQARTIFTDEILAPSACLGNSCGSGDGGFPLKLKDGLVRILFEDNDVISFSRDWAIQANDFIGGSDHFFIFDVDAGTTPFSIDGNAPDHALYVRSNGNLGLGTSTPAVRLDVRASTAGQAVERLRNSSATGYSGTEYLDQAGNVDLFFGVDNAASTTRLNSVNNNPIVVLTNSIERLRMENDGDVGIGTASPQARLNVAGGDLRIDLGASNGGALISSANDTVLPQLTLVKPNRTWRARANAPGDFVITDATAAVSPFRISANAGSHDRLVITTNGVDVIGQLRVNGTTMSVPDYIFEPDYPLMPLAELAAFLAQHKHLPAVPGADEVKTNGLDLSSFPLQLLAKIEELTLYTLEQHRTIESLEARLAALELEARAREEDR